MIAAAVARARRRVLGAFRDAGAFSPDQAILCHRELQLS
jgi:hypothetical protein